MSNYTMLFFYQGFLQMEADAILHEFIFIDVAEFSLTEVK